MAAGELETLQVLLQFQREAFVRKVAGVDDERARRRFVASDTTLICATQATPTSFAR